MKGGFPAVGRVGIVVGLTVLSLAGAFILSVVFLGFDAYAAILLVAVLLHLLLTVAIGRRQFRVIERSLDRLSRQLAQGEQRAASLERGLRGVDEVDAGSKEIRREIRKLTDRVDETAIAVDRRLAGAGRAIAGQLEYDRKLHPVVGLGQGWINAAAERDSDDQLREAVSLRDSPLFDEDWYRERHPDADEDPILHYVQYGAAQGSAPHPLFHSAWYVARYPSARNSSTPLGYFLAAGAQAGHDPHPLFASRWYADRYLAGRTDPPPVIHYLTEGWKRGCQPHPLFDVSWYQATHERWLEPHNEPLTHFVTVGAALGLDPGPSVDVADLTDRLLASGSKDPLTTFLERDAVAASSAPAARVSSTLGARDPMADAKWDHLVRRAFWRTPDAVLYRIIGNDLPPRHLAGQGVENVRFILENESELEGCEKRWVVNRITDPEQEAVLVGLLEAHDQTYTRIPFVEDDYRRIGWRFEDFERPGVTYAGVLDDLPLAAQRVAHDHAYHEKNLYVMNNNGARNLALREGRRVATWVLPWDGNCFITPRAWEQFRTAVTQKPHAKYVIVPMARVLDNGTLLNVDAQPYANEEPQIAFRCDAAEEFDEDARYGRRPKVRLFYRIGLEGIWDRWVDLPWETASRELGPEAGQFIRASWVARLFSGQAGLEANMRDRGVRRFEAIRSHLDSIDERLARRDFRSERLFALSDDTLEFQRDRARDGDREIAAILAELRAQADADMRAEPVSVLDKDGVAPSGELHDYWNPDEHSSPDPSQPNGRAPGVGDRLALRSVIDGSFHLSLAWYFTGEDRYAVHAADLVRTWFLDPATRMNPTLAYAHAPPGHLADEGPSSGVMELRDLHRCLDAARLVERAGAFNAEDRAELLRWLQDYRQWLEDSSQGCAQRAKPDHHSTWYEVQIAAICAYLDDVRGLLDVYKRLEERCREHFDATGRQPKEVKGAMSLERSLFNLQAWTTLAQIGTHVGVDLWKADAGPGEPCLAGAVTYLLGRAESGWPHRQDQPVNRDAVRALAWQVCAASPATVAGLRLTLPSLYALPPVLPSESGVRPYWQLGMPGLATDVRVAQE